MIKLSLKRFLFFLGTSINFYLDQAHRIGQYKYRFGFTTNKEVLKEMKYSGCVLIVYRPVCRKWSSESLIFLGQICC